MATIFQNFFFAGYDKIVHININAKISKKIIESFKSCKGALGVIPSLFSSKKKILNGCIKKDNPMTALIESISLENLSCVSCNPCKIKKMLHAKKKEVKEKLSKYITISIASITTKINYGKFILRRGIKLSF